MSYPTSSLYSPQELETGARVVDAVTPLFYSSGGLCPTSGAASIGAMAQPETHGQPSQAGKEEWKKITATG